MFYGSVFSVSVFTVSVFSVSVFSVSVFSVSVFSVSVFSVSVFSVSVFSISENIHIIQFLCFTFSVPLTYLEIEQNIVTDLIDPIRHKHGERYDGPKALVCHISILLVVGF